MKFINSVTRIFESEIAREQRLLAEIEQARQDREARQRVVSQLATLRDRLTDAEAQFSAVCAKIDRLANYSVEGLFQQFISGPLSIEALGERLAQIEAASKHSAAIKKLARIQIIQTVENQIADFEKQHASALKGIDLKPSNESAFVPTTLPINHYADGGAAALTARVLGPQ
jgi:regulator of protease activity HflC (stomatin/prohibitin superfamily)